MNAAISCTGLTWMVLTFTPSRVLQRMTDKCFKKCIGKPGSNLDNSEQVGFPLDPSQIGIHDWLNFLLTLFHLAVCLMIAFSFPVFLEMHSDVHGPVYGLLEYCVSCLQLPVAEGKITYLNYLFTPSLLLATTPWPPSMTSTDTNPNMVLCSRMRLRLVHCVYWPKHTTNFWENTSQAGYQRL